MIETRTKGRGRRVLIRSNVRRVWLAAVLVLVGLQVVEARADRRASAWASRLLAGSPDAFLSSCRGDIRSARTAVTRLKGMKVPRETPRTIEAYDNARELLDDAANRASLMRNVHPAQAMRTAAEQCEHDVDAAATELSLDRDVYDALASLSLSGVDAPTRYYVERTLRDFRRAGVDRDPATRARIRALREELVKLGQEFGNNINSDVRKVEVAPSDLNGLPEDYRRAHPPGAGGKVAISTDNTDYQPFVTYSNSPKARETLWRVYRQRGHPKNLDVLARMLRARRELATLLGFSDWADYITGDKMIGTRKNAADFIAKIAAAADERAGADYAELLARKRRDDPTAATVDAWDSGYLQDKVKAEKHGFDSQAVRPYFEYRRVRQGVLDLASRMFRLSFREVRNASVWHADVDVYDVYDGDTLLGRVYLDMYPRENKYKHYATFQLTNGKSGGALPEGVLVCNFPRPGSEPALMDHSDVKTFLHEFGHLLHHVLGGHTRWAGISGVSTEWDFVEAPSQMLEEWAWDPVVLQTFARHYQTNEPIPTALVGRMKAADEFGKGLYVRQQMFYAAISLEFHSRDPKGLDTTRLVADLQERYTPYKYVEGTYFHESFTHLDGYSAIYYTYMWSLVIAKDMFTVFKEGGLLNPAIATRYRRAILEPGGSKRAAELVSDFLGRPYQFRAYEEWLNAN